MEMDSFGAQFQPSLHLVSDVVRLRGMLVRLPVLYQNLKEHFRIEQYESFFYKDEGF